MIHIDVEGMWLINIAPVVSKQHRDQHVQVARIGLIQGSSRKGTSAREVRMIRLNNTANTNRNRSIDSKRYLNTYSNSKGAATKEVHTR